jgi:hypothetical protein
MNGLSWVFISYKRDDELRAVRLSVILDFEQRYSAEHRALDAAETAALGAPTFYGGDQVFRCATELTN